MLSHESFTTPTAQVKAGMRAVAGCGSGADSKGRWTSSSTAARRERTDRLGPPERSERTPKRQGHQLLMVTRGAQVTKAMKPKRGRPPIDIVAEPWRDRVSLAVTGFPSGACWMKRRVRDLI